MENIVNKIILVNISELTLPESNAKIHTKEQINHIINSIEKFGMNDPVGIWGDKNIIVEGVGRYSACKKLGIKEIPCIRLDFLNDEERRAYALAHNLTAAETGFDIEILNSEIKNLNFEFKELGLPSDVSFEIEAPRIEAVEDVFEPYIMKNPVQLNIGDVFEIGEHRLIYGDSTDSSVVEKLMNGKLADMIFTDPPYNKKDHDMNNIKLDAHFVRGSGMATEEYQLFLEQAVNNLYDFSKQGSIHFICMDYQHMFQFMLATKKYEKFKQLIVWVKHVAGFGSFYRCQHELIFCFEKPRPGDNKEFTIYTEKHKLYCIFQKGNKEYTRNFEFKDFRSNVWNYPGQSHAAWAKQQGIERVHPTMKPIQLIADAIQDCSNKGNIILDLFGGSGSTMVAAHQTNRKCYMVELDEKYINVIIKRMLLFDGNLKVYCNSNDITKEFKI